MCPVEVGVDQCHSDFGVVAILKYVSDVCKQAIEGTLFLVDISIMPGLADMSVTLKWIVNSLLYRNGHVNFKEILVHALHQFAAQAQGHTAGVPMPLQHLHNDGKVHELGQNTMQQLQPNGRDSVPVKTHPASCVVSYAASRTASHATSQGDDDDVGDADEEAMSARDYLCKTPLIDAGKFEQVWATAIEM